VKYLVRYCGVLFVLIGTAKAVDEPALTVSNNTYKGNIKPVRAELQAFWTFGIDADDFFKDYKLVAGGKASGFAVPIGVALNLGTYQLGNASIGLSGAFYKARMNETYEYAPRASDTSFGPPQTISQEMTLTCVPVLATIDYYPFQRQFTGYVGAGIGLGSVAFSWAESISPSQAIGARAGGVRYDNSHFVPAFLFRTGISLGFDKELGSNTCAALTVETSYLYMPFSAPIFATTADSFVAPTPARLRSDYKIQAGGFQLRIGFVLFIRQPGAK